MSESSELEVRSGHVVVEAPAAKPSRHRRRPALSARYVAGRLLTSLAAVWAVFTIVYFSLLSTGNPAVLMVAPDASQDEVDRVSRLMGFDRPPIEQYFTFLLRLASGQLPESIRYGEPVLSLVLERLPASFMLGGVGLVVGVVIGGIVGYVSATSRIRALRVVPVSGLAALDAVPSFFLGIVLILVGNVWLGWFPASGNRDLNSIVLPAAVLAVVVAAPVARIFRTSLIDALDADHVRAARSKGVSRVVIAFRHVIGNSLPPTLNVVGVQIGMVLGGAVVTETIFSWPGLGQLSIAAMNNRDYPLVLACVVVIAVGFTLANLVVDFLAAVLDPRSRK